MAFFVETFQVGKINPLRATPVNTECFRYSTFVNLHKLRDYIYASVMILSQMSFIRILLLFFSFSIAATSVRAAILDVPGTYIDIDAAVAAAVSGDIIVINAPNYFEASATINKNVTVKGTQNPIGVQPRVGFIYLDSATIENVNCSYIQISVNFNNNIVNAMQALSESQNSPDTLALDPGIYAQRIVVTFPLYIECAGIAEIRTLRLAETSTSTNPSPMLWLLDDRLRIRDSLILVKGIVQSSSATSRYFSLLDSAIVQLPTNLTDSYINGPMGWIITPVQIPNGIFTFPVGRTRSGSQHVVRPFRLEDVQQSLGPNQYIVEMIDAPIGGSRNLTSDITGVSPLRYYSFRTTNVGITFQGRVTLLNIQNYASTIDGELPPPPVLQPYQLRVAYDNNNPGSTWIGAGGSYNSTNRSITSNLITRIDTIILAYFEKPIILKPVTLVPAPSDTFVCHGRTLTLNSNVDVDWRINGTLRATNIGKLTPFTLPISNLGSQIRVDTLVINRSDSTDTLIMTVYPEDLILFGRTDTVCKNGERSYSSILRGNWEVRRGTTTAGTAIDTTGITQVFPTAGIDTVFFFTPGVDLTQRCTSFVVVYVNDLPNATFNLPVPDTICNRLSPITMSGGSGTFSGGFYSLDSVAILDSATQITSFDPAGHPGGYQFFYYYNINPNTGCFSIARDSIFIKEPLLLSLGRDTTVCRSDTVTFRSSSPADWFIKSGNTLIATVTNQTDFTVTFSEARLDPDTLVVTGNGCSDTLLVRVNEIPDVRFEVPSQYDSVCFQSAEAILLTGIPSSGIYLGDGIVADRFFPANLPSGTYVITYIYTDTNTRCDAIARDSIFIRPKNRLGINTIPGYDTLICLGISSTFLQTEIFNTAQHEFIRWRKLGFDSLIFQSELGIFPPTLEVTDTGLYYAQFFGPGKCLYSTDTVYIGIRNPVPVFPPRVNDPIRDSDIIIRGTCDTLYTRNGLPDSTIIYVYINGILRGSTRLQPDNTWSFRLTAPFLKEGDLVFARSATDNNCDKIVDSLDIKSNPSNVVVVYNKPFGNQAFSPNTDGFNDRWVLFPNIEIIHPGSKLRVYSRWGDIVYSSDNYANDWDGGNAPDGTYFWTLTFGNTDQSFKGTVTIMR